MNKKKVMIAAIVLALVLSIGGILAYFTDEKTVTNTFTIGNVAITLTEPNWVTTDTDSNGVPDAAQGKMPGQTIAKDPTVTNTGDNNAFIFVKVQVACTSGSSPVRIFNYTPNSGWYELTDKAVACTAGGTETKVFAYGTSSAMTSVAKNGTAVIFNEVTVNNAITGATEEALTGNKTIVVKAYAIQADGLSSTAPGDVWTAGSFS